MKRLFIVGLFLLVLVYPVSAITWTSASGCWTATDGTYNYVRINATGAGMWTVPSGVTAIDYNVVGGGGGGGSGQNGVDYSAGGGGGGGYINGTAYPVTPGGYLNYTVGGGGSGAAADGNCGTTGGPSYFGIFTIYGGGGGGGETCPAAGGGSGGGGSIGAGGVGIAGQGLAGGDGKTTTNSGGGGGGNQSIGGGAKAPNDVGGEGGQGTVSWLTGEPLPLACGGGGSGLFAGGLAGNASGMACGGVGGFSTNHGGNAIINTGSGGGGTTRKASYSAGDGSNGVIYIRYASSVVSFDADQRYGAIPLTVYFNSVNSTVGLAPKTAWAFNWTFGDGGTSTNSNATHIYSSAGIYTVNLTINAAGTNVSLSKPAYILAGYTGTPTASFVANVTDGNRPMAVLFTDTSTGGATQWNWSFGDGNYSVSQNPTFTYNIAGTYTVNLTASNVMGNNTLVKTAYIVVHPPGFPLADFSASPRYGSPGILVQFTDLSTHTNNTNLAYNWSFGDGTYSSTIGNVQHVYAYASVYDVNLTVTNAIGTDYELKSQYIAISTDTDYLMKYPPSQVTFHVQEFFGAPISGATVYATGIMTSTGNWDWVAQLLGFPLDEIPFNVAEMNMTTDSDGDASFLMINSVKYNITVVKSGYTFPTTIIAPAEKGYTIVANYNGTPWFTGGNNTQADVNVTVSSTAVNSTYGRIRVTYDDTLLSTTGGTISIYQGNLNRSTLVATMPITGNTFWDSVDLPRGSGTSYTIQVSATNSLSSEPYTRTFTAAMKPQPVQIPGFTSTMLLWFALFIIIFTAAFAGAVHAPQMAIVICIESWVFWAIGWLEPLSLEFSTGELGVIGMLSLATVMAVIWNFREGKRKEKGT